MSERRVILCPGQGAQAIGMGKAWFDASAQAAQTYGAADQILADELDARLSEICFTGPEERLNRTDIAQPAIFATSIACHQAMLDRNDVSPSDFDACAGLSLGEYTALHVAGAISFTDGLRLVALRGRAMQEAAEAEDGGMVALIGADEAKATEICEAAAGGQILVLANFNAPGQIVLSGHGSACDRAVEQASNFGVRASRLSVAGAFHSPLMAPAADRLAAALEKTDIEPPNCPVVSNVTARPHGSGPDADVDIIDGIRRRLIEQLTAPVRWEQSCRWLAENVAGEYHELAPGKVLAGLMRRIERSVKVTSHDQPD